MSFDMGPLAAVHSGSAGDRWTLAFTKALRHPPERVWAALTDPPKVGQSAHFDGDRDLGSTGRTTLCMVDGDTGKLGVPA